MAISQKLHTKLVQKLILTPSLQQAIKLLPMSTLELSELLNQEIVENPLLEESQEMGTSNEEPVSAVEMQDGVELQGDGGESEQQLRRMFRAIGANARKLEKLLGDDYEAAIAEAV